MPTGEVWDQLVSIWETEFSLAVAEDGLYALTATSDPALINVGVRIPSVLLVVHCA